MFNLNVLKAPPWFHDGMGVPGADTDDGLRMTPSARTIYVSNTHPSGSLTNDGTDPENPCSTIVTGIARMALANGGQVGDQLVIAAGDYAESIQVGLDTHPSYCHIRGEVPHRFRPQWASVDGTATPAAILGCLGWTVSSIRFVCPTGIDAVVIPNTQAPYTANDVGIRTHIISCYFDGQLTGLSGINLHGAPYDVQIEDCLFSNIANAGNTALAIRSTNTGFANPRAIRLLNNDFYDCDAYVVLSLNGSIVKGNTFNSSTLGGAAMLDLRGGTLGENVVVGNYLGGDYSNTGGYYANAGNPGNWVGNFAEDVAEGEVGDNGITVAVPAA